MVAAGRRVGLPRWSVRARILAAILLVVFVGLGVTGSVSYLVQRDQVARDIDADLLQHVDAARGVVETETDELTTAYDALARILAVVPAPQNGSAVGIVDGEPALIPGTAVAFSLEDSALVDRVVLEVGDGSARIGTALLNGVEVRYVGVAVLVEGAPDEGIYLVAVDVARELAPTNRSFTIFAVVGAATLLAVALAGWLVAGRLLRPVRTLQETAARLTASDLKERIPVDGNDDISRLTETVNDMLDRLEAALRNQRELLDDVRHELRTPLTVIRGHLELVDPTDADDVQRTTDLAIDELQRMAGLVNGLAALAEVRAAVPDIVATDIGGLTRDMAALASVIPGHDWSTTQIAEGMVPMDRALITQAWLQLADNAAKYAPKGTSIELGSHIADGNAELWVRDYGPGIRVGQEKRIFERFARATDGSAHGSGLGLAIVDGIAQAHGGAARVESSGDGARFIISIPTGGQS